MGEIQPKVIHWTIHVLSVRYGSPDVVPMARSHRLRIRSVNRLPVFDSRGTNVRILCEHQYVYDPDRAAATMNRRGGAGLNPRRPGGDYAAFFFGRKHTI